MASSHPAPFSPGVLDCFARLIPRGSRIHDPFAGEGVRLGKLADEHGWTFTGTELEAPFILDDRVVPGNAIDASSYPPALICSACGQSPPFNAHGSREHQPKGYSIVTSPVYPNGIADDFNARDGSRRRTYRAALAKITGTDAPLHPNNQGRWGYRGTPLSSSRRAIYWHLADQAVACWGNAEAVYLNVSDFVARSRVEPVVEGWARCLTNHGWTIVRSYPVSTRRWRDGANRESRVDGEVVLHCRS